MPTATAIVSRPFGVDRGPVDRAAQRALAGDAPDQAAVAVDDRRDGEALIGEPVEDLVGSVPSAIDAISSRLITFCSWREAVEARRRRAR